MRIVDSVKSIISNNGREEARRAHLKELSHEMKTPLTVIICYAQLLKDEDKYNVDKSFTRAINSIEAEGKRLTSLIDKYIDFSK